MSEVTKVIEVYSTLSQTEVAIPADLNVSEVNVNSTLSQTEVIQNADANAVVTVEIALPHIADDTNRVLVCSKQKMIWVGIDDLLTAYFKDHGIDYLLSLNS